MDLQVMDCNDVKIFMFKGRLDISRSMEIEEELYRAIDCGSFKLILDLGNIDCLSSSGLRIFISVLSRLKEKNGRLGICNIPPHIFKVFNVVGLDEIFEIYDSADHAIACF
ncbi:MAG: putative anti-sigma factor antagonist BtrV [Syntrophus sp. SKADARSKE-3]|nr:putative anti-sigma factor antagonist BtrV [Syntrophus sp. SKADARSKE-3]